MAVIRLLVAVVLACLAISVAGESYAAPTYVEMVGNAPWTVVELPVASSPENSSQLIYLHYTVPPGTYIVSFNATINPTHVNGIGCYNRQTSSSASIDIQLLASRTAPCPIDYSPFGDPRFCNFDSGSSSTISSNYAYFGNVDYYFDTVGFWLGPENLPDAYEAGTTWIQQSAVPVKPGDELWFALGRYNPAQTDDQNTYCNIGVQLFNWSCPAGQIIFAGTSYWPYHCQTPQHLTATYDVMNYAPPIAGSNAGYSWIIDNVPMNASLIEVFLTSDSPYVSFAGASHYIGAGGWPYEDGNYACAVSSYDTQSGPTYYYSMQCYSPQWGAPFYINAFTDDPDHTTDTAYPTATYSLSYNVHTCSDGSAGQDCTAPLLPLPTTSQLINTQYAGTSGFVNWYLDVPAFTWEPYTIVFNTSDEGATVYVRRDTYSWAYSNGWDDSSMQSGHNSLFGPGNNYYGGAMSLTPWDRYSAEPHRWVFTYQCNTGSGCQYVVQFTYVQNNASVASAPPSITVPGGTAAPPPPITPLGPGPTAPASSTPTTTPTSSTPSSGTPTDSTPSGTPSSGTPTDTTPSGTPSSSTPSDVGPSGSPPSGSTPSGSPSDASTIRTTLSLFIGVLCIALLAL